MLVTIVLGILGAFLIQLIKRIINIGGNGAMVLAVAVSIGLGFLAMYIVGSVGLVPVFGATAVIFMLSSVIYQFVLSSDGVFARNL